MIFFLAVEQTLIIFPIKMDYFLFEIVLASVENRSTFHVMSGTGAM